MKEWFSAAEIARLKIPCLPKTKRGVVLAANREGWTRHPTLCREREGRGGGREFHYTLFPPAAIAALKLKAIKVGTVARKDDDVPLGLSGLQSERFEVRAAILAAYDAFGTGLTSRQAQDLFSCAYNTRQITVADWVIEAAPAVAPRTLRRWLKARKTEGEVALAGADQGAATRGVCSIDLDEDLKAFILAVISAKPHVTNAVLLQGIAARFEEARVPHYRTLSRFTRNWRAENKAVHMRLVNPDRYRGNHMPAAGKADGGVHNVNQEWQLDSTPTDVMLADGKRHNIVGVIDVYTRRMRVHVSRTSTGHAVAHLLRTTMIAWGVPTKVTTDNGADYQSRQVVSMLAALGVKHHTCAPFSPHQKPFIERALGTLSHDTLELAPGYIGHDVAQRKDIEARKSFAQRLAKKAGDRPTIELNMTADELQQQLDAWCEAVYAHRPHSGLNGKTPFEVFSAWQGAIAQVPNVRGLEILSMFPIGLRVVGKKGLAVNGGIYNAVDLGGLEGQRVFLRQDPENIGKVYVFGSDERSFICVAEDPAITGVSIREIAIARKQRHNKLIKERVEPLKAAIKAHRIDDLYADIHQANLNKAAKLISFPKPALEHETPALTEASKAAEVSPGEITTPTPQPKPRANPVNDDLNADEEAAYQEWRKANVGDGPIPVVSRRKASSW